MESQKSKLEFEKKSDWTSLSFLKTLHRPVPNVWLHHPVEHKLEVFRTLQPHAENVSTKAEEKEQEHTRSAQTSTLEKPNSRFINT